MNRYATAGLIGAIALSSPLAACTPQVPSTYTNCLVLDKDRSTLPDGKSDMRVYTDRCGEFKIRDAYGIRDSARIYGGVIPGKTYTIQAYGTRSPEFSKFPTAISFVEERVAR